MNKLKIESIAPILGCLLLAACGGGDAGVTAATTSATISGEVRGFHGGTLLLNNAGTETIAVTADGNFSFAKRVPEGTAYAVTVLGERSGISCEVTDGTGTVAHSVDAVSNVSVTCDDHVPIALEHFNVGVTVTGLLPGNSLTLINNGRAPVTAAENGLFVFPEVYATTSAVYLGGVSGYEVFGRVGGYEVTVKAGPSNQTCTVSEGSGTVTSTQLGNFVNVPVSCK